MSSVIGALRVNLGLDSAQFSRGLSKSRGDMSRFAARIGKMAAGLAGAFTSSMTALGVGAVNAGAEIKRLSQIAGTSPEQFQKWAAGARSVGIEQDKLADILKDVNDRVGDFAQTGGGPMADFFEKIAPKIGITAAAFRGLSGADALQLYVSSLEKANLNQQDMTFYMEAMASDSTLLLPLLRDGGTALAEYARRAEEVGAVMSNETVAALAEGKSALADMRLALDGMRNSIGAQAVPLLKAMAAAVTAVAVLFHEHAGTITNILLSLAGTAAVVAAAFAGRYAVAIGVTAVKAMAAAVVQSMALEMALGAQSRAAAVVAVGVKGLSRALVVLRGAIISTGIGALVVGAGVLVGQFLKLVAAAGGVGAALRVLGEVASEAWGMIRVQMAVLVADLEAGWKDVQAGAYDALAGIVSGGVTFANRFIGIFRGAFGSIKAIWGALPAAMGDVVYGAANITIKGIELMVKKAAGLIDGLTGSLAKTWIGQKIGITGSDLAGAIDFAGVENPYAGKAKEIGQQAKDAFLEGFKADTFSPPAGLLDGLAGAADGLRAQGDAYREAGRMLRSAAERPMTAWQKLKALLKGTKDEVATLPDATIPAAAALEDLGNAGKKVGDKIKDAAARGAESLAEMFTGILKGTTSAKDALLGLIAKIIEVQMMKGFTSLFGAGGAMSGVGSFIGSLIGANANGTNNWRGGLTSIHERGGEIVDLPSGTRIIPHDVSKRMVDRASGAAKLDVSIHPSGEFDARVERISGGIAVQTAGEMINQNNRSLMQAQRRG